MILLLLRVYVYVAASLPPKAAPAPVSGKWSNALWQFLRCSSGLFSVNSQSSVGPLLLVLCSYPRCAVMLLLPYRGDDGLAKRPLPALPACPSTSFRRRCCCCTSYTPISCVLDTAPLSCGSLSSCSMIPYFCCWLCLCARPLIGGKKEKKFS